MISINRLPAVICRTRRDWSGARARTSSRNDAGGVASRVESRRFHLTRSNLRGDGQRAIGRLRGHCSRHPQRHSEADRQTAPGRHGASRHYSVAGPTSRLFAQWVAYRGRNRGRARPGDVRLRCGRGLQRDRRVGPNVSGDGGGLHRHRRACWLGDRLRTLEAARTIPCAARRNDENRSGSSSRTPQGHGARYGFLTNEIRHHVRRVVSTPRR